MAWTKYGLIISFSFKSIGCGMGLMDNGPLNSKQIFVPIKVWPVCKKSDGLFGLAVQPSV